MSAVRGRSFPALVSRVNEKYYLELTVPGPTHRVRVSPPQCVLADAVPTDAWPSYTFQLLLLASEYCAALQEFLEWGTPKGWESHKLRVVEYARQLISNSAAVMPPTDTSQWNAYSVWAAFTYCYFHGTGHLRQSNLSDEEHETVKWLRRLVGEQGWRPDGAVYQAAERWVSRMRVRLAPFFSDIFASARPVTAVDWPQAGHGGWERSLAPPRRGGTTDKKYFPVYPYRVTGGEQNRVKFTLKSVEAPRNFSSSCGVPAGYSQTSNCALGFLLAADVMQAFFQASSLWGPLDSKKEERLILGFFESVLSSDEAPLCRESEVCEHLRCRYPAFLAGCTLGWELALGQAAVWVAAVEQTAKAAVGIGFPPQLRLPQPDVDLFPLQLPQQQQQQQQQHAQPLELVQQPQPQQPQPQELQPTSPVVGPASGFGYSGAPSPALAAAGPDPGRPSLTQELFAAVAINVPPELGIPDMQRTLGDYTGLSPFAAMQLCGNTAANMPWPAAGLPAHEAAFLQQHPQEEAAGAVEDVVTDSFPMMSLEEEGAIRAQFGLDGPAEGADREARPGDAVRYGDQAPLRAPPQQYGGGGHAGVHGGGDLPHQSPVGTPGVAAGLMAPLARVTSPSVAAMPMAHIADAARDAAAAAVGGAAAGSSHAPSSVPRFISEGVATIHELLGSLEQLSANHPTVQQEFMSYLHNQEMMLRAYIQYHIFNGAQEPGAEAAAALQPPPAAAGGGAPQTPPQPLPQHAYAAAHVVPAGANGACGGGGGVAGGFALPPPIQGFPSLGLGPSETMGLSSMIWKSESSSLVHKVVAMMNSPGCSMDMLMNGGGSYCGGVGGPGPSGAAMARSGVAGGPQ